MKNLLVVGGTGFLGKQICLAGLQRGWRVTSLSRSGLKDLTGIPVSVVSQIQWKKADVFNVDSYKEELESADAVVHSMGLILESPEYKNIINSKSTSICSLVNVGLSMFKTRNPLENGTENSSPYYRMNKESAITLAKAFSNVESEKSVEVQEDGPIVERSSEKPFIYISAHDWNPLVPRGYIQSKRAAEEELTCIEGLRNVFLRPGFMYDSSPSSSTIRDSVSTVIKTGEFITNLTGLSNTGLLPKNPSISVQTVARAAIEALEDSSVEGVVSLEALQKFATFEAEPKVV